MSWTKSTLLAKTGNLKAVMNAMGHGDVRSALLYQHPQGEIIRNALTRGTFHDPPCPTTTRQVLEPRLSKLPIVPFEDADAGSTYRS